MPPSQDRDGIQRGILILADESAGWQVGGLEQLRRLLLAFNELGKKDGTMIDVAISWKGGAAPTEKWDESLPHVRIRKGMSAAQTGARVVATRLFVARNGLQEFLSVTSQIDGGTDWEWRQLFEQFASAARSQSNEASSWQWLDSPADIRPAERKLLCQSGKSQDGFVARFLNRPISRAVTRILLKYPITPTAWTMSIFVLPILASLAAIKGTYLPVLIGTLLFHFHSVLDGCDGEIARAKYRESEGGRRIDDLCDVAASIMFVIALGFGLSVSIEGLLCGGLIALNEWLLRLPKAQVCGVSTKLGESLYPRHRGTIQNSGVLFFGEKNVWWFLQLTKRDVGILFFVLFALIGRALWIVHLWLVVTAISFTATIAARLRTHVGRSAPESRS